MTMFLIQALIWLLIAFFLGYVIGRFLKSLFCGNQDASGKDVTISSHRPIDVPPVDAPPVTIPKAAAALGGAAAVGAAAAAAARFKAEPPTAPSMDFSGINPHKPIIDPPDMALPDLEWKGGAVEHPNVELKAMDVNFPNMPEVELLPEVVAEVPAVELSLPDADLSLPTASLDVPSVELDVPDIELQAPNLAVDGIDSYKPILDLPDMDVELPTIAMPDVDGIDPHKPILDLPDMDVELPTIAMPDVDLPDLPAVNVEGGNGLLDAVKVAVVAAGTGLAAKAASAMTVDAKELPDVDLSLPTASLDVPSVELDVPDIELKAPSLAVDGIDPHKPILDLPDMDVELPTIAMPDVDGIDPHKPILDLPDMDVELPTIAMPDMSMELPEADLSLPMASLDVPSVELDVPNIELQAPSLVVDGIDPHKPILDLPDMDVELPTIAMPDVDLPDLPAVNVEGGNGLLDAVKVAVVAAGTGLAAKAASAMTVDAKELPDVDLSLPTASLDVPSVELDVPDIELQAPSLAVDGIDPHKPILDLPDMDVELPTIAMPDMSMELPEADLSLPTASLDVPSVELDVPDIELQAPSLAVDGIDPHKPILDLPDMDVELPTIDMPDVDLPDLPAVNVEGGHGLLDAVKVAVVAAGTGLAAKAASAMTVDTNDVELPEVSVDDDADEKNWLLLLVQQAKAAYRGHNHRAVSHLWRSGNTRDCSTLDDFESLSLQPATYDKLGSSHCGVPRAGFVAVGGDVSNIEQGSAVLFHYCNIVVCRDADDTHHFIRVVAD